MLGTSASFTPTCFLLISYFLKGDSFIWQTYNAVISRSILGNGKKVVLYVYIPLYIYIYIQLFTMMTLLRCTSAGSGLNVEIIAR